MRHNNYNIDHKDFTIEDLEECKRKYFETGDFKYIEDMEYILETINLTYRMWEDYDYFLNEIYDKKYGRE